jgi:hypothetical protein
MKSVLAASTYETQNGCVSEKACGFLAKARDQLHVIYYSDIYYSDEVGRAAYLAGLLNADRSRAIPIPTQDPFALRESSR